MGNQTSVRGLKQRINVARFKVGGLILLGTGLSWAMVLFLTTDYFKVVNTKFFIFIFTIVTAMMLYQGLNKRTTRSSLASMHIVLHLSVIFSWPFLLPPLSPFSIFVAIFALWVYLDFGKKALTLSITSQTVGLVLAYLAFGTFTNGPEFDTQGFLVCLAVYSVLAAFTYFMSVFFEITIDELVEVQRASHKTKFERERLAALVGNMDDAVLACDSQFNIALHNPATLNLLNTHDILQGRPLQQYLQLQNANGEPINIEDLVPTKSRTFASTDYRLIFNSKDDFINLFIAITAVKMAGTREKNFVIVLRDITKEKSLEEERNEFVSIMSHELRTPVSIVEGGITLARNYVATDNKTRALEYLDKAHDQSTMLAEIIHSLSTLVHNETRGGKISKEVINPVEIATAIARNYQPEAAAKGLKIELSLEENLPQVTTNKEYLYEIMQNFVTNALKYTHKGTITIGVSCPDSSHVSFSVKDTGIGMSTADLKHIFEKFWRSEDYRTRTSSGTGLGLYLTRKLATSIHGSVAVKSVLNEGSTFSLTLPAKRS